MKWCASPGVSLFADVFARGRGALKWQTRAVLRLPLSFFFLALGGVALADDWPEFMGPHRNQTSAETGLLDAFPAQGPKLIFEKKIGTGYSAPSIRGKVMIVHHRLGNDEIVEVCRCSAILADGELIALDLIRAGRAATRGAA